MGQVCSYESQSNDYNTKKEIYQELVKKIPDEEKIITYFENTCCLRIIHTENITKAFYSESIISTLSFSQCKRILGSLGFTKADMENPDSANFAFLSSFESQETYPKTILIGACILLSGSRPCSKIQALFDLFDPEGDQIIDALKVSNLLELIFKISTYHCLYLSLGPSENNLSTLKIEAYSKSYTQYEAQFINDFKLLLLISQLEISKERFTDLVCKNYLFLVSPYKVREQIFANYIN